MREFQLIYIAEVSQGPVLDGEILPHQISRPKATRPPRTVGRIHVEAEGWLAISNWGLFHSRNGRPVIQMPGSLDQRRSGC